MGGDAGTKTCPYCAETIKAAAIKCRFCGSVLGPGAPSMPPSAQAVEPVPKVATVAVAGVTMLTTALAGVTFAVIALVASKPGGLKGGHIFLVILSLAFDAFILARGIMHRLNVARSVTGDAVGLLLLTLLCVIRIILIPSREMLLVLNIASGIQALGYVSAAVLLFVGAKGLAERHRRLGNV